MSQTGGKHDNPSQFQTTVFPVPSHRLLGASRALPGLPVSCHGPSGLPVGPFNEAPSALGVPPTQMAFCAGAGPLLKMAIPTYARLTRDLRQNGSSRYGLFGALSKPSCSSLGGSWHLLHYKMLRRALTNARPAALLHCFPKVRSPLAVRPS